MLTNSAVTTALMRMHAMRAPSQQQRGNNRTRVHAHMH